MKVLFGCLALTLVVGVASSEARWFGLGKRRCLPRAIDSPIIRPKVKEYHKAGKHQKHPGECSLLVERPATA
ncbi:MAG: hypothetical protein DMF82_13940 [Acidobacteria bacterium]|nr:MAG: hypothetical protein DMF82_13940 [Acidobacteriota bacterium]